MSEYIELANYLQGDAEDSILLGHLYFEMPPERAQRIAQAIRDLVKRLEIEPGYSVDGIECRDETIQLLEARNAVVEKELKIEKLFHVSTKKQHNDALLRLSKLLSENAKLKLIVSGYAEDIVAKGTK